MKALRNLPGAGIQGMARGYLQMPNFFGNFGKTQADYLMRKDKKPCRN